MFNKSCILAIHFAILAWVPSARADIFLSTSPGFFDPSTKIQTMNVFAHSNAMDSLIALVVDFDLPSGGEFTNPPGTFLQAGMIGSGNSGISLFNRDAAFFSQASMSLDFAAPELFPETDQLIGTLSINTSDLVLGNNYPVTMLADAQGISVSINTVVANGNFTVVPEPSSIGLLSMSLLLGSRRRIRRSSR